MLVVTPNINALGAPAHLSLARIAPCIARFACELGEELAVNTVRFLDVVNYRKLAATAALHDYAETFRGLRQPFRDLQPLVQRRVVIVETVLPRSPKALVVPLSEREYAPTNAEFCHELSDTLEAPDVAAFAPVPEHQRIEPPRQSFRPEHLNEGFSLRQPLLHRRDTRFERRTVVYGEMEKQVRVLREPTHLAQQPTVILRPENQRVNVLRTKRHRALLGRIERVHHLNLALIDALDEPIEIMRRNIRPPRYAYNLLHPHPLRLENRLPELYISRAHSRMSNRL